MSTELPLIWTKLSNQSWCKLLDLDLALIHAHGVYVIWHGGYPSRVVRVGHGDIGAALQGSVQDPRVLSYLRDGPLLVTWAAVDASVAAGVHRYLEDRLHPLVADHAATDVVPVAARPPF